VTKDGLLNAAQEREVRSMGASMDQAGIPLTGAQLDTLRESAGVGHRSSEPRRAGPNRQGGEHARGSEVIENHGQLPLQNRQCTVGEDQ